MAIVIESQSTNTSTNSTDLVLTKPTGLAISNVMVAALAYSNDNNGEDFNTPAGWTKVGEADSNMSGGNDDGGVALFYKLADSGDVAASNFTFTKTDGSSTKFAGVLFRLSGIRTDTTLDNSAFGNQSATAAPTLSYTITPDQDNVLYIAAAVASQDITNVALNTNNPSWTEQYQVNINTEDIAVYFSVFTAIQDETAAITNTTFSLVGSGFTAMAFGIFGGQNAANATLTTTVTSNTAFVPAGSAGANATLTTTVTENEAFDPAGRGSRGTPWSNEPLPTTTWTNEPL